MLRPTKTRLGRVGQVLGAWALAGALIPGSACAATVNVTFGSFFFSPQTVTVNVGDTVVWSNTGGSHTVTGDGADPICGSGTVPVSCSHTFNTAGTFSYHCIFHASFGMTGTVIVQGTAANQPPTVSLTNPANGAVVAAPFGGMIQATASDPDGTVAKVDFFANGNPIGTATQSPFSVSAPALQAGTYTLTAVATDNQGATTTSSPITLAVDAAPTVSISSPANGAVLTAPANVAIQAAAADSDGSVVAVDFFANGNPIGTVTQAPFSLTLSNASAGSYALTAKATDDKGLSTLSSPASVTVNAAPTVSITSPTNDTLFITGTNIALLAAAADTDDRVARVDFYRVVFHPGPVADSYDLLRTATNTPYAFTLTNVQPGFIHVVAAATDALGATNLSAQVRLIVYTPVHFTSAFVLTNSTVRIDFTGTSFVIEASPDLQTWTQVTDSPTQNTDGSWTLVDTQAQGVSRRFYRARHVFNEVLPL